MTKKALLCDKGKQTSAPGNDVLPETDTCYKDDKAVFFDNHLHPVRQATLRNHHMAIEESVDIDNIWEEMSSFFTIDEQNEIQCLATKRSQIKKMVDFMPNKNDKCFNVLVASLRPRYRWLSLRLERGMEEEKSRLAKVKKGMKRKIAVAMLTARISERQKEGIIERVSALMDDDILKKSLRVNIPDHRATARLEKEHQTLREICDEVDDLLYGQSLTQIPFSESISVVEYLQDKIKDLIQLKECYAAFDIVKNTTCTLPTLLLQRIHDERTTLKIEQDSVKELNKEIQCLSQENSDQHRNIEYLKERCNITENDNINLQNQCKWLQQAMKQHKDCQFVLQKNLFEESQKARKLTSELQRVYDQLSGKTQRIKQLDVTNSRLTRENCKLSTANMNLRKDSRNKTNFSLNVTIARNENKLLKSECMQLKKDVRRLDKERCKLSIRCQKLQTENSKLRGQKQRLLSARKKSRKHMPLIQRRPMTLCKYNTPLPPIPNDPPIPSEAPSPTHEDVMPAPEVSSTTVLRQSATSKFLKQIDGRSVRSRSTPDLARGVDNSTRDGGSPDDVNARVES